MNAVEQYGVSIALACRAFEISETCYRYSPVLSDENEEIADWLERLTTNKRTWGFGLCFLYLRNVQGYGWNHKRVYRIYCELALNLRPSRDIASQCPAGQWIAAWSRAKPSTWPSASAGMACARFSVFGSLTTRAPNFGSR